MLWHLTLVCLALLVSSALGQGAVGDSCIDQYTKTEGRCVEGEKCKSAQDDFYKNGIRPTQCDFTKSSVLVCCRDGFTILQTPSPKQKPKETDNRFNTNAKTGSISNKKCTEYSRLVTETVTFFALTLNPEPMTLTAANCSYAGTELIVGGENAKRGEFPHMAAIGWTNFNGNYSFDCGGALISPRFVMTAAHCTFSKTAADGTPAIVRLGDQNLNPKAQDGANPVEVAIRNIYKHPGYKSPKRYDDIALLELATDVEFNKDIRPACLWTDDDLGGHTRAIATGWGVTNSSIGRTSDELQKVSLSILDTVECNQTLSFLRNRKWANGFVDTQMCAGEKRHGKDTCQGDSGSPLQVASEDNQCIFKIIGITSFGPSSCGHLPAIYTRVSSYINWIESIVWPDE